MNLEDLKSEIQDLLMKNKELVQKLQHWKMIAAQRENDKLELMKENNDLRLSLSRLRSTDLAQVRSLDSALQSANEEVLTLLVRASETVAQAMQISKNYIRERLDTVVAPARWSSLGGAGCSTPKEDKVHKVRPMMGGQSIQPVVTLSRVALSLQHGSHSAAGDRGAPAQTSVSQSPLPLHMLQDVIIPLRRIDTSEWLAAAADRHTGPDEEDEVAALRDGPASDDDHSGRLGVLLEGDEDLSSVTVRSRGRSVDPQEGPSWMLDPPPQPPQPAHTPTEVEALQPRPPLEPDSTTETEVSPAPYQSASPARFSPTTRRRPRPRTPPTPTSPLLHRHSMSRRVLKVLVPKMPAPSPHGATDGRLIVIDQEQQCGRSDERPVATADIPTAAEPPPRELGTRPRAASADWDSSAAGGDNSAAGGDNSAAGGDSSAAGVDSSVGRDSSDNTAHGARRAKRPRADVTYKEKPLNRKLRR